ncbi:hypothetical protein GTP41_25780 [Pseudoduganella sp. DS3]|uniref:DUF4440 domain-containing protein n=1 Tax=Pseudoduganella guangdongensis TaxID=2692179 RepID=A0A6N9HPB6_9BURK|nr:hypothetical protein [Pseudoduganella guangdongensis]MYN05508.1 hypothetical protein [Pseudoduganella guangdongensis]
MRHIVFAALALGLAAPALAQSEAEALFAKYKAMERAFDPELVNLYCDTALIRNVRSYPDGQQRTLELPAPRYKELIRNVMPLAKARGDVNTYSEVAFSPEGGNTRITATRHSEMKKYSSPISLLVGKCGNSVGILEELSQSKG